MYACIFISIHSEGLGFGGVKWWGPERASWRERGYWVLDWDGVRGVGVRWGGRVRQWRGVGNMCGGVESGSGRAVA